MAVQTSSPDQARAEVLQGMLAIERARNEQLLMLLGEIKGIAQDERITRLITESIESPAAIAADEAQWNAQFAATPDDKLEAMANHVRAQIKTGKTRPMFTETGELNRP